MILKKGDGKDKLPFENHYFDIIINRHGDFNEKDIYRMLKPGGLFISEQVGAENDRELVELLLKEVPPLPFPKQYLDITVDQFKQCGFTILESIEAYRPIKFHDVGALVWFAHIIEWEFPGFNVRDSINQLYRLQEQLERHEVIEGKIHRYLIVARKEN